MQPSTFNVVIVGGGIAGLSAAWYLQREAQAAGSGLRYVLLEESNRWGGHILTEQVDTPAGRFIVEGGPDSFITQKPWGVQLARELGLGDRLLGTNDAMRKVFVLNRGKPTAMPDGVLLIVPTRLMPFVLSPLISPLGKLRMGLDLLIPPKRDGGDETLAEFVRRRLGAEALDKIAEPLLSGIYNSEAERQSLLATFPRFRDLEVKYGSLTRGMLASRRKGTKSAPSGNGHKPLSAFMSLRGGTGELVDALLARLTGELRLNTRIERLARGSEGSYTLVTAAGETLRADAVILAVPAFAAQALTRDLAPDVASQLGGIRYVSTGTISLAFRWRVLAWWRRPANAGRSMRLPGARSSSTTVRRRVLHCCVSSSAARAARSRWSWMTTRYWRPCGINFGSLWVSRQHRCSTASTAGSAPTRSTTWGIWSG